MVMLYDKLRNGIVVDKEFENAVTALDFKDREIVLCDNVAKYYFEISGKDFWDIRTDFPSLIPPFEKMYFEYYCPKTIKIGDEILKSSLAEEILRFGMFVDRTPIEDGGGFYSDKAAWKLKFVQVADIKNNHPYALPLEITLQVDESGNVIPFDAGAMIMRTTYNQIQAQGFATGTNPVCLAISFMNCRNVSHRKISPHPKLNRAYKKRHGKELVTYRVLEIEPIKKIIESEGDSKHNGLKKALHICRGHFKDYREHGLFGKKKGIYWWDNYVRGDSQNGIVVKDYAMPSVAGNSPVTP